MFQKFFKLMRNLMFSYTMIKIVKGNSVYSLNLNALTMLCVLVVIMFSFASTSYRFLIYPFTAQKIEESKKLYQNELTMLTDYDQSMTDKRKILKKLKSKYVKIFKETETDDLFYKSLDDCMSAKCIMETTIDSIQESKARAIASIPIGMPINGYVCGGGCLFGMRIDPISGGWAAHNGLDLLSGVGTPIYTTMAGKVAFSGYAYGGIWGGYGNVVIIDNGFYKTLYAHMLYAKAIMGTKVGKGQLIGYVGSTGYSAGPHVHYGIIIDGEYINGLEYISVK